MKAKEAGEINELGLKRIRYWLAAPNTSNTVESGDETSIEGNPTPVGVEPPPLPTSFVPACDISDRGAAAASASPMLLVA